VQHVLEVLNFGSTPQEKGNLLSQNNLFSFSLITRIDFLSETDPYLNILKLHCLVYWVSLWVLIHFYFSIFQLGSCSNLHVFCLWWWVESLFWANNIRNFNVVVLVFLLSDSFFSRLVTCKSIPNSIFWVLYWINTILLIFCLKQRNSQEHSFILLVLFCILGIVLVILALVCDALLGNFQERLFTVYKATRTEVVQ
jgi:hypothetical protein